VSATDAAGNTGSAAYGWTVDTVAPKLTFDSRPPDPSNEASPSFEFSTEPDARVVCSLDGVAVEGCASPQAVGPLGDGRHEFEVSATDAAGNTGRASYAWTVDTVAPEVTLDVVPRDPSNEASPSFEFSSEPDARVACTIDGASSRVVRRRSQSGRWPMGGASSRCPRPTRPAIPVAAVTNGRSTRRGRW
jgi:hypothetical protein